MALKFWQYNYNIQPADLCSIHIPGTPAISTQTWCHIMSVRSAAGQSATYPATTEKQTPWISIDENDDAPDLVVDGVGTFPPVEFGGRRPDDY